MDFVAKRHPEYDSARLMRVGRIATFLFMLFAAAWAPQIERFGSLFKYLQTVLAYIAPPVVAVFALGVLWRRANATGAFAALLTGLGCSLFLFFSGQAAWMPRLHFLYVAPILFVVCLVTEVVVSLATAAPPEETREFTWSRETFAAETAELARLPWWQNYRVLSLLLLLVTAVVVGLFW